ncbi:hypothetical protein [Gordonia sp. N1V]|uniref:hypothetical protein n=1 Tax=Gordonia sp. N1V TaxID=3034163 RepID=UPI0023E282DD|nr:hypothetical protein [Gordonia sp. N1V]MDF3285034.1 hypothetical protein [Gordonia sp. N1V]
MAKKYSGITPTSAGMRAPRAASSTSRRRPGAPTRAPRVADKPRWWRFSTRPTPLQWTILAVAVVLALALVIAAILVAPDSTPQQPHGLGLPTVATVLTDRGAA